MIKLIFLGVLVVFVVISEFLWRRKNKVKKDDWPEIGKLMFDDKATAFQEYINLFTNDRKQFAIKYGEYFEDIGLEVDDLQLVDLVTAFGLSEGKILTVDWRGEENEGEVQKFCEKKIGKKIEWTNVNNLLERSRDNTDKLFEAIKKDLNSNNYQLVFMNLSNDSYELTAITTENYNAIRKIKNDLFKNQ